MTPRERITSTDRKALAFIAHFPGADTECVTQALLANESTFDTPENATGSIHPTKSVVGRRLAKLARLGAIQSWRSPAAQVTHHGILDAGYDALEMFGEAPILERGITHKSGTALMHCRDIAAVAAQVMHGEYANPHVTQRLGNSVSLDAFITDQAMNSAVTTLRTQDTTFSLYQHVKSTLADATAEDISDPYFWVTQPELVVLTAPATVEVKHRTHRADMVILANSGKRYAVEVERSAKPVAAYEDIMRLFLYTYKGYESAGSDKPVKPVDGMIWLCASKTIKNAVTRAANRVHPDLIAKGLVVVADLTNADGSHLTYGDTVPVVERTAMRPPKVTSNAMRPPKVTSNAMRVPKVTGNSMRVPVLKTSVNA